MSTDPSQPTSRAWAHNPLKVAIESAPGSGDFIHDPRATVDSLLLTTCTDDQHSVATIRLFPGRIDSPTQGTEEALNVADVLDGKPRLAWETYISPDQKIMVYQDDPEGSEYPNILFDGYCDKPQYERHNSPMGSRASFNLMVESVVKRMADSKHGQILGRRMRIPQAMDELLTQNDDLDDTTPAGTWEDARAVPTYPCTFNADGYPNRSASPVEITVGGESYYIHVFTADGDPHGKYWTWAQVLNYLFWWHMMRPAEAEVIDELASDVSDGNVLESLSGLLDLSITNRPSIPAGGLEKTDALKFALLGEPRDLKLDGHNIVEAMTLLACSCGARMRVQTEADPNDERRPIDRLYIWARGCGDEVELHNEGESDQEDVATTLSRNNINDYMIRADYSDVLVDPVIVGDTRRYEVTVELVPGWKPDSNLDDVVGTDAQTTALNYANLHISASSPNEDSWYQRYHKKGSLFQQNQNRDVGRLWALNETGWYDAESYARAQGCFVAEKYLPWNPSVSSITDRVINDTGAVVDEAVGANDWSRRPRPFRDCFTADKNGHTIGIVVEVSFTSGESWTRMSDLSPVCRSDQAAIYFSCDDLTQVIGTGGSGGHLHVWQAMLTGVFRVRVTAVIEGDDRVQPNRSVTRQNPPANGTSRVILLDAFKSNRRDGGNSQYKSSSEHGVTYDALDDVESLQSYAQNVFEVCGKRQTPITATIPWLTTAYSVGQSLRGISGVIGDIWVNADLSQKRRPDIVGVQYTPSMTSVIVEDFRLMNLLTSSYVDR